MYNSTLTILSKKTVQFKLMLNQLAYLVFYFEQSNLRKHHHYSRLVQMSE